MIRGLLGLARGDRLSSDNLSAVQIAERAVTAHGVSQSFPEDAAAIQAAIERDVVASGRLAATVITIDGGAALFESDDGWVALHDAQITVLDASVVYQGPDGTVSAAIRAR